MKKLIIAVFLMILILSNGNCTTKFTLLDYFDGDYTCYVSNSDVGVDLGFCSMVDEKLNSNIIGESMVIKDLEVGDAIESLGARVVEMEYLDSDIVVIYCY